MNLQVDNATRARACSSFHTEQWNQSPDSNIPHEALIHEELTPEHQQEIEEVVKKVFNPAVLKTYQKHAKFKDELVFRWQRAMKRLLPLGGASEDNKLQLMWNNEEALISIWNDIDTAKERVWLETYTIGPDHIGLKTIRKLVDAKQRGCDVRVLFDRVGSPNLFLSHFHELIKAGGQVQVFNELLNWPWRWRGWGLKRNHRKIVVVDQTAHSGSMNLAEQYAGKLGVEYFRDTQLRIQGPAVKDLENVFLDSWNESSHASTGFKISDFSGFLRTRDRSAGAEGTEEVAVDPGHFVQILQNNSLRNRKHIQAALRTTLNHANSHCYITTPYFIPPHKLSKAIIDAAQRGVDVQILTSGMCDLPFVKMASTHILHLFLKKNVRIFAFQNRAIHSKTATIDGIYSSVGSFNLETWSHYYNLEVNITIVGTEIAGRMEEQFAEDLKNCIEVKMEDLEKRPRWLQFVHWFVYHGFNLFYLMRKL